MKKISLKNIYKLYNEIASIYDLYLPIKKHNSLNFEKYERELEVDLNTLQTVKSAKDMFFPQSEDLVYFETNGQNINIKDDRKQANEFVIFGVRACDNKSFEILDKVFLAEPVDSCYQNKREKAIIFTLACQKPQESCFCKNFKIDAAKPGGDVECRDINGYLYLEALTERGKIILSKMKCLEDAQPSDKSLNEKEIERIHEVINKLPFSNLDLSQFKGDNLMELFNRPEWTELSNGCLGCGTCTFVCPTCQCFDIKDFSTNNGVKRFRCWDSCMYSDFTKMAAANPRTTQVQRFRQRFMHKLVYYPSNNNGVYSCVGCGRCVKKCPQSLNIVKVIKKLGGKEDVK